MELKVYRFPYPQNLPERRFWIGLACAALIHASLVVGLGRSQPRQLGERDGSPDAISVELVDPSALIGPSGRPTPPEPAAQAAAPAAAPASVPARAAQTAPTPTLAEAPASPPGPSFTPPSFEDLETASLPPKEAASPQELTTPPGASSPPPPAAAAKAPMPGQATAKPKPNPQLSLQLDLPTDFAAPSGLSTAAVRPPDITRSGENDEFGRRVIRALRQTMPPARGELGRVTVRLLLSATGDLSELQLVRAADPSLTQSVVFAVKQSSFPIPPTGATRSDRTFLVTYIYN
jgi:protein TonB